MTEGSNSRPVVGAAVWADDLELIDGLPAFLMDSDRDVEIRDFYLVDACAPIGRSSSRRCGLSLMVIAAVSASTDRARDSNWTPTIPTFALSPRRASCGSRCMPGGYGEPRDRPYGGPQSLQDVGLAQFGPRPG